LREPVQLAIEQREELVAGRAIPRLRGLNERADVGARTI
jgi:hypothetical protein